MTVGVFALLTLTLAPPLQQPTSRGAGDSIVVITNANVLPMDTKQVLANQSVVVERGIITRMGPTRSIAIPAGARTIDAAGKYLMPGLVDVHVHLHANPEDQQRQLLKLFLANGVTTIVNLRGTPQILDLRTAVNTGRVLGPRLYTVGPYVNEPFVTSPEDVERAVVEQKRAGYDFIKLHGSLSQGAYHRLNEVARREGIRVIGHAPRNLGPDAMFAEHQYMIAHAEEFLYDTLNRSTDSSLPGIELELAEWGRATAVARIWLTPNLTAYKAIARQVADLDAMLARPEMRYLPRANQVGWGAATNPYTTRIPKSRAPSIMDRYHLLEKLVATFQRAGVRMLVGTDAMNTGVIPGFSAHDEMADLVTAGLTPFEALRAATANGAEFLAEPGDRGTVAAGQKADLLLLDANPLDDIANSRRIAGVVLRGQWFSRGDITAMLKTLESEP